jgi:hypothetical protein
MAIEKVIRRWRVKLAHWLNGRNATNVGAALLGIGLGVPAFITPVLIVKSVGGGLALVGFLIILAPTIREWRRRRRNGEVWALLKRTENRTTTTWEDGTEDVDIQAKAVSTVTFTGIAVGTWSMPTTPTEQEESGGDSDNHSK